MMTPLQCQRARSLLNWSPLDLADEADMSLETVMSFEHGSEEFDEIMYLESIALSLQNALERAGINFYNRDDCEPIIK